MFGLKRNVLKNKTPNKWTVFVLLEGMTISNKMHIIEVELTKQSYPHRQEL